jgi:hypothetical protein
VSERRLKTGASLPERCGKSQWHSFHFASYRNITIFLDLKDCYSGKRLGLERDDSMGIIGAQDLNSGISKLKRALDESKRIKFPFRCERRHE